MDTPAQFLKAWEKFVEHSSWVEEAILRDSSDVAQARIYLEEGRAFFARWKKFLDVPEAAAHYRALQTNYDGIERALERAWREALLEGLRERERALLSAMIHHGTVVTLQLHREVPEHLREGFMRAYMGDRTDVFDPEREYRESEEDLAAAEEKARLALAKLEVDWPEKMTDPVRERWKKLETVAEAQAWLGELRAELERGDGGLGTE